MALTAEQLERRRQWIGGSEMAATLGLDQFSGPLEVYLGKVEGLQRDPTPDMERGTFLEPGIIAWHLSKVGGLALDNPGTLQHRSVPRVGCTPDLLYQVISGDRPILASIKAPRRNNDRFGEHGGTLVPEGYAIQLQVEDAVLASHGIDVAPTFDLVALLDGELRAYKVERDLELQEWLLKHAATWWHKHVDAKAPPPLDGSDAAHDWLRRRFPRDTQPLRAATLTEELLCHDLQAAAAALKEAEARHAVARQLVEEVIGDAGGLSGSFGRVSWRANSKGIRSFKPKWNNGESQ